MTGSKQGLPGKDGCMGKLVWGHYSGNFKNLWLWQPVLDKLNCILELKNWLPFNKTYLWTDLIEILSCTGIFPACTPITLLMYTYILDWEFFSDRRICQLLKPSDVWRKCYQTYQPSDLSKLPSWSCAINSTFAGEEQWWIQCRQNENQIIPSKTVITQKGMLRSACAFTTNGNCVVCHRSLFTVYIFKCRCIWILRTEWTIRTKTGEFNYFKSAINVTSFKFNLIRRITWFLLSLNNNHNYHHW